MKVSAEVIVPSAAHLCHCRRHHQMVRANPLVCQEQSSGIVYLSDSNLPKPGMHIHWTLMPRISRRATPAYMALGRIFGYSKVP